MPKGSSSVTKDYLNEALTKALDTWGQRLQSSITESIGGLARHMSLSFAQERQYTDNQFVEVNTKLDAIMESVATRKEMHNLVRELKHQGIQIDSSKVFVA